MWQDLVQECANLGIVLLVSSVRTIAKALKALENVDALLKANRMPKAYGFKENGELNEHANGVAKKSN
jgi:signal recognition particle receptor subunit beta